MTGEMGGGDAPPSFLLAYAKRRVSMLFIPMQDLIPVFGPILLGLLTAIWPSARILPGGDVWWDFERLLQHDKASRRAWWHCHHVIDFARAWGALELVRLGISLATWAEPAVGARVEILAVMGVAAMGGVAQLRCPEREESALAALAYTAGLVFGFVSPVIAGGAVIFALASTFAFRSLWVYFVFLAGAILGLGVLLQESKLMLATCVMALLVPVGVVFMGHKQYVVRFSQRLLRTRVGKAAPRRE